MMWLFCEVDSVLGLLFVLCSCGEVLFVEFVCVEEGGVGVCVVCEVMSVVGCGCCWVWVFCFVFFSVIYWFYRWGVCIVLVLGDGVLGVNWGVGGVYLGFCVVVWFFWYSNRDIWGWLGFRGGCVVWGVM